MIEDLKGMKETIAYGSSQFRLMKNQETEDYPPHWHTSIEIIMPLENGYQAVIGTECYTLNPLDLLFINSGEIHSLQAPATGKRLIFQAPLSLFYSIPGMGSALLLLPEAVCLTPTSCPELFQEVSAKFKEIIREAEKSNYLADAWVSSAVIQIVLLLVRHNFEHTPRFTDVSFSSRREYMEKFTTVCQYIDTSFRENLTLEQAAEIAGFSKYHFSRLFKEFTGITFQEYLTRQRIRHAEELLNDSKISITDIALASGFSSVSNFNRSFQMYNHCSPSQFRKKLMLYSEVTVHTALSREVFSGCKCHASNYSSHLLQLYCRLNPTSPLYHLSQRAVFYGTFLSALLTIPILSHIVFS